MIDDLYDRAGWITFTAPQGHFEPSIVLALHIVKTPPFEEQHRRTLPRSAFMVSCFESANARDDLAVLPTCAPLSGG
jgi:hypothetical protein